MNSNEANKDIYSTMIPCLMSYLVGFIGWNSGINGFCVLALLSGFWALSKSRLSVFFVILSYYGGACHELYFGAVNYFVHGRLSNIYFWVFHQMILASGWVIFWKKDMSSFWDILLRLSLTYLLTIFVPPYSLLGIAHPVTAAGFFFPGIGILGILFFTCFTAFFAYLFVRLKQEFFYQVSLIISVIFIFMPMSNIYAHSYSEQPKEEMKGRVVIQTEMGDIQIGTVFLKDYERHLVLKKIVEQKINDGYRVIIFPEMIAGQWSEVEEHLWADVSRYAKGHRSAVLLGAQHVISNRRYDNTIIVLGDKTLVSKKLLKARVPMPLSNWNPFSKSSATLNISRENNGVIVLADEPAALLICYEQMLVWPILQSMTSDQKPKVIITASNLWWAKDTNIPQIMENTTKMWGRLFKVPILRAVNT